MSLPCNSLPGVTAELRWRAIDKIGDGLALSKWYDTSLVSRWVTIEIIFHEQLAIRSVEGKED